MMDDINNSYFEIISEYEDINNSLCKLRDYLIDYKSNILRKYCSDDVYLSSYVSLEKITLELTYFIQNSTEVVILFHNAIEYSKAFYAHLIGLILESTQSKINFERKFQEEAIQSIGQQLISTLVSIRNQLRIFKIQRDHKIHLNKNIASSFFTVTHNIKSAIMGLSYFFSFAILRSLDYYIIVFFFFPYY